MKYLLLALAWGLYFFLHSLLATNQLKGASGLSQKNYRLLYSVVSVAGLLAVLVYMLTVPASYLWNSGGINRFFGLMLATYGIIIGKAGFRFYSLKEFLGLKAEENPQLVRQGILQHVRHPLYLATVLLVTGYFLFSPTLASLVTAGCIIFYLFIGIYFEEKKLVAAFGEEYRRYQQEVPMLFPRSFRWH